MPYALNHGFVDRYRSPFPKTIADSKEQIIDQTVQILIDSAKSIREQCMCWVLEALVIGPDKMNLNYTYEELTELVNKALKDTKIKAG